jgi:hypothetical protein
MEGVFPLGYLGLAGDIPDLLQFFLGEVGKEQDFFQVGGHDSSFRVKTSSQRGVAATKSD